MEGRQKLFYCPTLHDFIFAVIGEELGILGALRWSGSSAPLARLRRPGAPPTISGASSPPGDSRHRRPGPDQRLGGPRPPATRHPSVHQRGRLVARLRALRRRPRGHVSSTETDVRRTVLVAAGGPGAPLPGIAVADELVRREPGNARRLRGDAEGARVAALPSGLRLELLPILPLNGVGLARMLKGLLALPWGLPALGRPRLRLRPPGPRLEATPAAPVTLLAALLGVRAVILEPNANRIHQPRAETVRLEGGVRLRGAQAAFRAKGVLTGQPRGAGLRGDFPAGASGAANPSRLRRQPGLGVLTGARGRLRASRGRGGSAGPPDGPDERDEVEAAYRAASARPRSLPSSTTWNGGSPRPTRPLAGAGRRRRGADRRGRPRSSCRSPRRRRPQRTNAPPSRRRARARMLEEKDLSGESLAAACGRSSRSRADRGPWRSRAPYRPPGRGRRVAELALGAEGTRWLRRIQHVHSSHPAAPA